MWLGKFSIETLSLIVALRILKSMNISRNFGFEAFP
jgi:hypothetical protein